MKNKSIYFLYGYFGAGNFGDDILLQATIQNIIQRDSHARFVIRSYGDIHVAPDIQDRVTYSDFESIHWSQKSRVMKLALLLKAYWLAMGRVSTLVVGGGTLIHDKPALSATILLTCMCLIARIRGKKVIGIGLGAQDIKSLIGKIICFFLILTFHHLYVRDKRTFHQFTKISADNKKIILATDLAYTKSETRKSNCESKIIAISFVKYVFSRLSDSDRETSLQQFSNSIRNLIKKGYKIRLLALQKPRPDLGVTGDRDVFANLFQYLDDDCKARITIHDLEANEQSIHSCLDNVSVIIGMRFHALVFAATHSIPFIGLGTEPKVEEICQEYNMPCLPPNHWSPAEIDRAIGNAQSNGIDQERLSLYRQRANKNFENFP